MSDRKKTEAERTYAQAMADAEAIVRAVFDETPGTATDVYVATVQALRDAAKKGSGDE